MLFEAERALRGGYRAWLRGELGKAISLLESSRGAAPDSVDPLYPLARALSESGEGERALAVIGEAIAREPANPAGPLYRAIILHDHGDFAGARRDLDRVPAPNPLAQALRGLGALGEHGGCSPLAGPIPITPAARWIADAAGRILGVLEVEFHARGADAMDFHHKLFSPRANPADDHPARKRPRALARPKEWRLEVESAFRSKDFDRVEGLHNDVQADWSDTITQVHRAFALIALGREKGALIEIARHLLSQPEDADFHFLAGVAYARAGRCREAGWAFTRAARLADLDVESVIRDLASKITGRIAWQDEPEGPRMPSHPAVPGVD
jgi:tetratricopeptide (TPR) repeat protein